MPHITLLPNALKSASIGFVLLPFVVCSFMSFFSLAFSSLLQVSCVTSFFTFDTQYRCVTLHCTRFLLHPPRTALFQQAAQFQTDNDNVE